MTALILSIIAAVSSTLVAIWSVSEVARKMRLENRLKIVLANNSDLRTSCMEKQLLQKLSENPPDAGAFTEARTLVNMMVEYLSKKDREKIIRVINQNSYRGQANYMAKLLEIARCEK